MSAPPYSLVATDLDGTIVRSDGTISARTREALRRVEQAGALVVFVTGRPPRWLSPVAAATGHRGLAICANGAYVYDLHDESIVDEHVMQMEVALDVVRRLREGLPELAFAVERRDVFGHEPAYLPRWEVPEGTLVAAIEALVSEPVAKLLARHDSLSPDELLAQARAIVGELATLTHSSREGLLEVSAAGVSKASTLETFCLERGIASREVIAFGDMPNDLPLLAWAGRAVAVANAHPEVLAAVSEVCASNDADGVAQVLERLF